MITELEKIITQNTMIPSIPKERKWYFLDLKGVIVGRVASKIVSLLRGKQEKNFLPNLDLGSYVVLTNATNIKFTGNKLNNEYYYNHSGHPGGLRKRSVKVMLKSYPVELVMRIIQGMMPHTKLGDKQLKRLFIYSNENHRLQAQEKNFIKIDLGK